MAQLRALKEGVVVVGLNNWQDLNQLMTVVLDWIDCYLRIHPQPMFLDVFQFVFDLLYLLWWWVFQE